MLRRPPTSTLFPYPTLFRSRRAAAERWASEAEPLSLWRVVEAFAAIADANRSEEHTSELQSQSNLVCRLLLEKKKKKTTNPRCMINYTLMSTVPANQSILSK